MTTKHPIGFNVRSGIDWGKLLTQVKAMGGCRTMLFRCYKSELHRLHDYKALVDTIIWLPNEFVPEKLREQEPDAAKWINDRQAEMAAAGFQPGDLWLHLHNEAGWSAEMIAWERTAIIRALESGVKTVALNQGVGNPNEHQVALADSVLHLASLHASHVLIGIHDGYFSVFGSRTYPWYLGRWQATSEELGGGHSYESYRKAKKWGAIRYVVTEGGAEDISHDHPFTRLLPRTGSRQHVGPFRANEAAWKRRSGDQYKSLDLEYIAELKASWPVGKLGDARLVGYCLFTWGNGGGQWDDYDFSGFSLFLSELAKWKPAIDAELPPFPPKDPANLTPAADDKRWVPYLAYAAGTSHVNIRSEPRVTSTNDIGDLTVGAKAVQHIPFEILTETEQAYAKISGQEWKLIKLGNILGWVQGDLVRFDPNPPKDPPVKPSVLEIVKNVLALQGQYGRIDTEILALIEERQRIDKQIVDHISRLVEGV